MNKAGRHYKWFEKFDVLNIEETKISFEL